MWKFPDTSGASYPSPSEISYIRDFLGIWYHVSHDARFLVRLCRIFSATVWYSSFLLVFACSAVVHSCAAVSYAFVTLCGIRPPFSFLPIQWYYILVRMCPIAFVPLCGIRPPFSCLFSGTILLCDFVLCSCHCMVFVVPSRFSDSCLVRLCRLLSCHCLFYLPLCGKRFTFVSHFFLQPSTSSLLGCTYTSNLSLCGKCFRSCRVFFFL